MKKVYVFNGIYENQAFTSKKKAFNFLKKERNYEKFQLELKEYTLNYINVLNAFKRNDMIYLNEEETLTQISLH